MIGRLWISDQPEIRFACDHLHPKNDTLASWEFTESLMIDTEEKVFGVQHFRNCRTVFGGDIDIVCHCTLSF